MAQAPLDDATLCLIDLAAAIATGNNGHLRESAERAVAQARAQQAPRLARTVATASGRAAGPAAARAGVRAAEPMAGRA